MNRREFFGATAAAMGASDRLAVGFIGLGAMGGGNLGFAMAQPGVRVAALCDVRQEALERAVAAAAAKGHQPKAVRDFREILADRSIDAVCIAAPPPGTPTTACGRDTSSAATGITPAAC
jgi:predicted dehydrogenase